MNNPLAETHIPLSINIFDQTQHALVRKHLTVDRLISDILREFAQELDLNRKYILLYDGRQLDPELVIGEANFDSTHDLVFAYYEPVVRTGIASPLSTSEVTASKIPAIPLPQLKIGVLREMDTGQEFVLTKSPSIIGRSSSSGGTETIDIDVLPFREARTVSRPHAQITQNGGKYYFEGLKDQRPVFINDAPLAFGKKQALQSGDVVGVGNVRFVFDIR